MRRSRAVAGDLDVPAAVVPAAVVAVAGDAVAAPREQVARSSSLFAEEYPGDDDAHESALFSDEDAAVGQEREGGRELEAGSNDLLGEPRGQPRRPDPGPADALEDVLLGRAVTLVGTESADRGSGFAARVADLAGGLGPPALRLL
jgi:hypothetical protein